MNYRYIILFLILSHTVFADCIGYNDTFDVRVLDAKNRPIPGAEVQIKYDRGATFGDLYFVTPVKYSDSEGKVPFNVWNLGTTSRRIDCTIYINATIGGKLGKEEVEANEHGPVVDVVLDNVYPVWFYVRDHKRMPVEGASVTLGGRTEETDEDGLITFYYKKGQYSYLASYLDARQAGTIDVNNDTNFEVLFTYHSITLDVVDDSGERLDASLYVFNQTFQLENGHFEYEKTFGETIPYTVTYKGTTRTGSIVPSANPAATVVYDIHSPLFGEITPEASNNWTKLVIEVSDPGEFASGLDVSSIKVTYRLEPSEPADPWNTAVTFSTGHNMFTADFPELPPNSIVNFRIEIKDKTGNRADIDGKFTTFRGGETPQDSTQNQTNAQTTGPEEQEIPLLYIIGGVILVFLIVYFVFRIKSLATGGD